jgi:hypothetical protein
LNGFTFGLIQDNSVRHQIDKLTRLVIVLLTLLAWFSISNHCVFGLLQRSNRAAAPAACHAPAPVRSDGKSEPSPCCKILRATLSISKDVSEFDPMLVFALLRFDGLIFVPDEFYQNRPLELDTGPPLSRSFAESVLQRSILAHAPPVLA